MTSNHRFSQKVGPDAKVRLSAMDQSESMHGDAVCLSSLQILIDALVHMNLTSRILGVHIVFALHSVDNKMHSQITFLRTFFLFCTCAH
jgi:hypothetical protein